MRLYRDVSRPVRPLHDPTGGAHVAARGQTAGIVRDERASARRAMPLFGNVSGVSLLDRPLLEV
jgi:hypothetical protein